MTRELVALEPGPGVTVQDLGRPGYLDEGLSRGGAADMLALYEGAALLGQPPGTAALEMAGYGGRFEAVGGDIRIALTGAPMRATIDGAPVAWHASHLLPEGQRLTVGGARAGAYGYLHAGGGIATRRVLGSRAAHLTAGIGRVLAKGDRLPIGDDPGGPVERCLDVEDRFAGGEIRVVASMQTDSFGDETERFAATRFTRDERGNRMGVRLLPDGEGFGVEGGLSVLSEVIVPGDIQITGDGTPFVLLSECQTTGGYPRIATVVPEDLPKVAQAAPGANLTFRFIPLDAARRGVRAWSEALGALAGRVQPLTRDPRDIGDLLSYQLIGGVTAGKEE